MSGLFVLAALVFLALLLAPIPLVVWGLVNHETRLGKALLALGVGLAVCWALLAWDRMWPGSAVLAEGTSPAGRDYCLVQGFRDVAEPYQVSLYVRDPAGIWWANTVDPDASSWRGATVESRGEGILAACRGAFCREVAVPEETVDLASVLPGYRLHYAPARFSCDEVLLQHSR